MYIYISTHFLTSQPTLTKLDNENIGGHLTPLHTDVCENLVSGLPSGTDVCENLVRWESGLLSGTDVGENLVRWVSGLPSSTDVFVRTWWGFWQYYVTAVFAIAWTLGLVLLVWHHEALLTGKILCSSVCQGFFCRFRSFIGTLCYLWQYGHLVDLKMILMVTARNYFCISQVLLL